MVVKRSTRASSPWATLSSRVRSINQLIEFQLESERVAGLGVLNEENHQKCNDGRSGVDYELPRIAEVEYWPCKGPYHHEQRREQKGGRSA
jgi:hypothetical protein